MATSYPEATRLVTASTHAPDEERGMSRTMAGMVLFIASEVMLFGGLFAGYFFVRNQADVWPPEGVEHTVAAGLGGVLTGILVASGVVGHFGIVAARRNNQPLFLLCIAAAITLGTVFIIGQSYEWLELMDEGLTIGSTVYGSTFYIMTGFHGAHVIAGLLMLLVVFVRAYWRDFTPARHAYADAAMLYWHFVDIVWVGLYILLYLV
jgi:cytochrome c oxidase subunit III